MALWSQQLNSSKMGAEFLDFTADYFLLRPFALAKDNSLVFHPNADPKLFSFRSLDSFPQRLPPVFMPE